MSWLMRTGTGRNNVSYGGGSTTKGQYLKRTANGRNNISYISISSNGTHKLLERYNTTRNGVRWNNLSFSFFTQYESTYKSSTTITIPSGCTKIDIFCVGGGGAGGNGLNGGGDYFGAGGGGGGYTKTVSNVSVSSGQSISIVVGAGGPRIAKDGELSVVSRSGTELCSSAKKAKGGGDSTINPMDGGNGGSGGGAGGSDDKADPGGWHGGAGGSNGGNGGYGDTNDGWEGNGQGTTTRAWGSSSGTLYSGGGGGSGSNRYGHLGGAGAGGSGGGGRGGDGRTENSAAGSTNTGGGGGASELGGSAGGSGIVLIRFKP